MSARPDAHLPYLLPDELDELPLSLPPLVPELDSVPLLWDIPFLVCRFDDVVALAPESPEEVSCRACSSCACCSIAEIFDWSVLSVTPLELLALLDPLESLELLPLDPPCANAAPAMANKAANNEMDSFFISSSENGFLEDSSA